MIECRSDCDLIAEEYLDGLDIPATKYPKRLKTIEKLGKIIWDAYEQGTEANEGNFIAKLTLFLEKEGVIDD